MQIDLDRKLILYFIKNIGYPKINSTLIFKLLFLADVEFYWLFSNKITTYKYKKHNYGPFCQTIYEDISYLEALNLISCERKKKISILGNIYEECMYKYLKDININLNREEKTIVDTMVQLGKKYSLKEIKNIVYALPNVKNLKHGETIDFESLKPIMTNKIKNLDKYKKLIKKMGLDKPEKISIEQSNRMVKDYFSWYEHMHEANRELLTG